MDNYILDIYASDQLIGSVGVQDGKLIFDGNVRLLQKMCADVGGKNPEDVLANLAEQYTGQGLFTRPHGAGHVIEHLKTKS